MANNMDYTVARCQQCGALNVLHKSRIEAIFYAGDKKVITPVRCGECAGELEVIDYAIMQDKTTKGIIVDVTVERGSLDRLIEDVGRVHSKIEEIVDKMREVREADMRERIYKDAPDGAHTLWYCNPERNTECSKSYCIHNTNATEHLCEATAKKKFALLEGEVAEKKPYTPRQK